MIDWKDLTVIACTALILLGAVALTAAAHSFAIVEGNVLKKQITLSNDSNKPPHTIAMVLIHIGNNDRVYNVRGGSIVQYALSENDYDKIKTGDRVKILVLASNEKIKVLNLERGN